MVRSVWVQQITAAAESYPQHNLPTREIELLCPVWSDPLAVEPLTARLMWIVRSYPG